jgi:protein SCO1/2
MFLSLARRGALLLACALTLAACGSHTFHGTRLEPPNQAPDFALTRESGEVFRLSEQRGAVVLLFFGFTHCPDVCPTALSDLAAVFRKLGPDAERVRVAFITIDPERDTPAQVAKYVKLFDKRFIGLAGARAEIDPIAKAYGVTVQRRDLPGSALVYTMDHSAFIYVIDPDGMWGQQFGPDVSVGDMADDIRYTLQQGGS